MDRFVQTTSKVIECTQNQKWPYTSYMYYYTPMGLKLMLFLLYDQRFPSYGPFCPNYLKGHWVHPEWKVTIHLIHVLLYPPGLKLTLFSLYDQQFPSYGPFCPNYLKGHWVHPESKVTIHFMHVLLYPTGLKLTLFSLYDQGFPGYGPFCPN